MQGQRRSLQFPADSANLAAEGGLTVAQQHRVCSGGSVPRCQTISQYAPFVTWTSALPFNITSGNDTNFDSVFHRPAGACPTRAGRCELRHQSFGLFNPNPQPGEPVIAGKTSVSGEPTSPSSHRVQGVSHLQGPDGIVASPDDSADHLESAEPHELRAVPTASSPHRSSGPPIAPSTSADFTLAPPLLLQKARACERRCYRR